MRPIGLPLAILILPFFLAGTALADGCLTPAGAPCPPCDPNDSDLLLPDLVAQTPTHVRSVSQTGHRVIIFTSTIGNVGDGPLIVHGHTVDTPDGPKTQATQEIWKKDGTSCTHTAGYFLYHPTHHHFHIEDFSDYQLRKDDPFTGEIVASSNKVSFCLLDIEQLHGFHGPLQVDANCLNQEGTQGISVGFADVYDSFLPGQSIDLDADPAHPVPAGQYFLVNVANPDGVLLQKNWSLEANSSVISVSAPAPPKNPDQPYPTNTPLPTSTGPAPTSTPPDAPTPIPTTGRQPHQPHPPGHQPPPMPTATAAATPTSAPPSRRPHVPHPPRQPGHTP